MDEYNQTPQTPSSAIAKRKKAVKIVLLILAGMLAVSLLGTLILELPIWNDASPTPTPNDEELYFYEPDWETNILEDPEYLSLDRSVYYHKTLTGETFSLDEETLNTLDSSVSFLFDFLESVQCGAYLPYADYFTDAFISENTLPDKFTMQMLYEIEIRDTGSTDETNPSYIISYKIHKNNGTYRRDIESDASRAQVFSLILVDGQWKIDTVCYYTHY